MELTRTPNGTRLAAGTDTGPPMRRNDPARMARDAVAVANDLAMLVAHEHRRAADERRRREDLEETAAELARLLAHEHNDLERERDARARAEAEARELASMLLTQRERRPPSPRRFTRKH